MSLPSRRHCLRVAAVPAVTLLLGACAGGGAVVGAGSGERALLERAQAYWDAIRDNDRIAAWPLDEVSLSSRWTLQDYAKLGGIVYHEAQVLGVHEISGDEATVDVRVRYDVPQARLKRQKGVIQDRWRLIDGLWYHVRRRSLALGTPDEKP